MSKKAAQRNYFSISDILSSQERIPCKFQRTFYRLGFLDPSSDNVDLQAGTKLEIPYWLAQGILNRNWPNGPVLTAEVPKVYGKEYLDFVAADARVINLHKAGPHYYSYGTYLTELRYVDSTDIPKLLIEAFKNRISHIMDISQNAFYEDTVKLTEKLDEKEKQMFKVGRKNALEFVKWQNRQSEKLTVSTMVDNHKKRKRSILD